MKQNCSQCEKVFDIRPSRVKKYNNVFCSVACYGDFQKGRTMPDSFHKNRKKWFKEHRQEHIDMLKKRNFTNERNPFWKGDNITYGQIHRWIISKLQKPNRCENCGEKYKLEWANKSHEYKRDYSDWLALCRGCHAKYDIGFRGSAIKRFGGLK
jgi:hypothetical protein